MTVLFAFADAALGARLQDAVMQAGTGARWDATQRDGPRGTPTPTVVVLDADYLGALLGTTADAWREHSSGPGLFAIGASEIARERAPAARLALLAPTAPTGALLDAIRDATRQRRAPGIRWSVMRHALGLPPADNVVLAWGPTLTAARSVDFETPRLALRPHAAHYATANALLDQLRDARVLTAPELETARSLDGTLTVGSVVKRGPLDPLQSARLVWALASVGAVDLTPEVRDIAAPPRRFLQELRDHLRARATRLERSTFYDVLEITPLADEHDIEVAYRAVGRRFAPVMLAAHDLGELAAQINPMWELVDKARSVLIDIAARGRYHDWLRTKMRELRTTWAIDPKDAQAGAEAYARGQKALGDGDPHRAMSELAAAGRFHPGHPEYEASLAWARYRVQTDTGKDGVELALTERKHVEQHLAGCRPWPQALVALALLCVAGGDPDTARWHVHVASAIDPNMPAAAQLAQRLGMRRP